MPLCTLHVGTMKTGTTTIQEELFFRANPRGFQYAGFGRPNGSFGIQVLFDDPSFRSLVTHNLGNDWSGIDRVRDVTWQRLERAVRRAKQRGEHLILSAEILYGFNDDSLERLRQFLQASGFEVRILGYLRPYGPYLESLFQTLVQMGKKSLAFDYELERCVLDYQPNVERFWRVFGRDRTTWVKFDPATFPQGCVVRDFCQRLGMPPPLRPIPRQNESLSMSAVQLLYSYNQGSSLGIDEARRAPPRYWLLPSRLRSLSGPPFRLHADVIATHRERIAPQIEWIQSELGFSLAEDSCQHDRRPCIRSEAEMHSYAPETLAWLARETDHCSPPREAGEATVGWVVERMEMLRERLPSMREIYTFLQQRSGEWYNRVRYAK